MRKILIRSIAFLLLLGIYSCKKKLESQENQENQFITIETADGKKFPEILTVTAEETTQSFVVKSNGSWKIVSSVDEISWISIEPDFGQGDGSFSIIMESNTTLFKREAQLTCMFNGQEHRVLKVEQESYVPNPSVSPISPLLDIIFKQDGTAEDISSLKHPVLTQNGSVMTTVYSNTFRRYMARFNHTPGSSSVTAGFYKMDYSGNTDFKNAISEGHTIEAMFSMDQESPFPNVEFKMFSSHQSGGTGLMIGNNANSNAIIFLPYTGSGYVWTNSGVKPEKGKYYHVVGVWNKNEGKSYIYVNGELKASVNASGNFKFPSSTSNWFGIGADPNGVSTAQTGWKGDVVIARVYNKPLANQEIQTLWQDAERFKPAPDEIKVSVGLLTSKNVGIATDYVIEGEGFTAGDKIKIVPVSEQGTEYLCNGTATNTSFTFKIPSNFITGQYRFYLVRGSKTLDMGFATLTVINNEQNKPQVIAHRGYWKNGAPQNSVASLAGAQELSVYGSECDVWITTDGAVVLNHDATINGIRIENVAYNQIKDITLSNGEKIPTLADYLAQGKKEPSTKLIIEIKSHSNSTNGINNTERAATAVVNMVKDANMTAQVEYIAWSTGICTKILDLQPDAIVGYLNGNIPPKDLHPIGIKIIDYSLSVIRQNTEWIGQAQSLGMKVNVWTVNSESDIRDMISYGVDYISTDEPVLAKQLINGY